MENSSTETQQYQCINCCGQDVSLNSIDTLKLMNGMTQVFHRELKRKVPSVTTSGCIAICHVCNSVISSLSIAYEEFGSRTGSNSLINRMGKENAVEDYNSDIENNKTNSTSRFSLRQTEENESILPLDCTENCENVIDPKTIQNGSAKNQDENTDIFHYEEKCLRLKIPRLSNNIPLLPTLEKHNCRFACVHCERKFYWSGLLETHYDAVHRKPETFSCPLCEATFINKWFYINHIKCVHRGIELNFSCNRCGENFASQNEVNSHNLSTHTITTQPFKCNHCETAYKTANDIKLLREHLVKFHPNSSEAKVAEYNMEHETFVQTSDYSKDTKCPSCKIEFENHKALYFHIVFDHYDHKVCEVCKKTFSSSNEFQKHNIEMRHSLTKCQKCQKDFRLLRGLVIHLEYVHDPSDRSYAFTCEICALRFQFYHQLPRHYKWHARNAGPRNFNCIECGKKFIYKYHLKIHMELSHDQKKDCQNVVVKSEKTSVDCKSSRFRKKEKHYRGRKCNICNERISGIGNLKLWNHFVKRHPKSSEAKISSGNIKTFEERSKPGKMYNSANKCSICKKHFTSIPEKDKHDEVVHKKVTCQLCTKSFSKESECRKHETESHSNFPCTYCTKIEESADDFHSHVESQHLLKPFICEFCGKYLGDTTMLSQHYDRMHFFEDVKAPLQLFTCEQCDNKFVSEKTLKNHQSKSCRKVNTPKVRSVHRIKHKCLQCGDGFNRTHAFEMHVMEIHNIYAGYECEECGTLYYDLKGLSMHNRRIHKRVIDEVGYNYLEELPTPKYYSQADQRYKCPHSNCFAMWKTAAQFNTHITRDHLRINLLNGETKKHTRFRKEIYL